MKIHIFKVIICVALVPFPFALGKIQSVTVRDKDAVSLEFRTESVQETHRMIINNGHAPDEWTTRIVINGAYDRALWQNVYASDYAHDYKIDARPEIPLYVLIEAKWKSKAGQGIAKQRRATVSVPRENALIWRTDMIAANAIDPTKRTRLGVGEIVTVEVINSHLGNPQWELTGPQGSAIRALTESGKGNWHRARFVTGEMPGICLVSAKFPTGDIKQLSFSVEVPPTTKPEKVPRAYTPYELENYYIALLETNWTVGNNYCSFRNVEYGESDENMAPGSTKVVRGTGNYADVASVHRPNPPDWLGEKAILWGDSAYAQREKSYFKTHWQGASFGWDIQDMYRVNILGSTEFPHLHRSFGGTTGGGWIKIKDVPQTMSHTVTGTVNNGTVTVKVTKYGLQEMTTSSVQ